MRDGKFINQTTPADAITSRPGALAGR
jgi:hypothetical protein